MRPGQLARKYDLPVQDIISYLEIEVFPGKTFHPNSRLDAETKALIFQRFDISPDEIEEETAEGEIPVDEMDEGNDETDEESHELEADEITDSENHPDPETAPVAVEASTAAEEIAMVEGEIETASIDLPRLEEEPEVIQKAELPVGEKKEEPKEDEVIQTDQLLEMLESEETPPDLEKIKLIKAPKKELAGLKVLGKIDVPEPKKKEEESESENQRPVMSPEERKERARIREEQREKKRLEAKRKQEEYEARKEKRRKEKEKKRQKAVKEAHYKQKIARTPEFKAKKHNNVEVPSEQNIPVKANNHTPRPKNFFSRLWRWFTTGSDW